MARRGGAILVMAFLIYCTSMQFNDPDAVVWVALYGTGAALAGVSAVGRAPGGLLGGYAVVSMLGAVWVLRDGPPDSWMHDEVGREAMGLALQSLLLGMLALAFRADRVAALDKAS